MPMLVYRACRWTRVFGPGSTDMVTSGRTGSPVLCGAVAVTVTLVTLACADVTEPSRTPEPANPAGGAFADTPRFRVDPFWARQLPNNWILGQVSGVAVDERDHVWIVHRPRTLDARQRGEEGMCCVPAPPVIEFSPDGTVRRSWGGPGEGFEWPESEHGIHVDQHGHVWIGGNGASDAHVLKFTSDGEFLLQIGRAGQSGGNNDMDDLGRAAGIEVDAAANEVYIADGYGNRRVIVYDAETGEYRRHWGAYGEGPDDAELPPYIPDTAPIRHFRSPVHDVRISDDGLCWLATQDERVKTPPPQSRLELVSLHCWSCPYTTNYVRTAGGSVRIFVDTLWRSPESTAISHHDSRGVAAAFRNISSPDSRPYRFSSSS